MKTVGSRVLRVKLDLGGGRSEILQFFDLQSLLGSLDQLCDRQNIPRSVREKLLVKIVTQLAVGESRSPAPPSKPPCSPSRAPIFSPPPAPLRTPLRTPLRRAQSPPARAFEPPPTVPSTPLKLKNSSSQATPLRGLTTSELGKNISMRRGVSVQTSPLSTNSSKVTCFLPRVSTVSEALSSKPQPPLSLTELETLPHSRLQSFCSNDLPRSINLYQSYHPPLELRPRRCHADEKIDSIFDKLDQKKIGKLGIENLDISALSSDELKMIEDFVLLVYSNGRHAWYDRWDLVKALAKTP